eukprot:6213365-Pleurochrysis_carterae.AAC.10
MPISARAAQHGAVEAPNTARNALRELSALVGGGFKLESATAAQAGPSHPHARARTPRCARTLERADTRSHSFARTVARPRAHARTSNCSSIPRGSCMEGCETALDALLLLAAR